MKKLLSLLVVCFLLLSGLSACSSDTASKDEIIGHWELSDITVGEKKYTVKEYADYIGTDYSSSFDIKEDGSFSMSSTWFDDPIEGTWTKEEKYILEYQGDPVYVHLENGILYMGEEDSDGSVMSFVKK